MFRNSCYLAAFLAITAFSHANGQDYGTELIDGGPESDEVSEEISQLLAPQGIRVTKDSTRTACELWFCKQWPIEEDFESTDERLYPFSPGQLIGVLHYSRRGKEFRDQSVSSGWYTLRFALQPVDGNHEGTSPTRDFFLMVAAEQDSLPENWSVDDLNTASAEAAGASHPAMLCLQRATEGAELSIRQNESNDWWVLHFVGKGSVGGESKDVPIDLVVVGHASE